MKRMIGIAVAGAALAAAIVLLDDRANPEAESRALSDVPAPSSDVRVQDVRVQHEIVTLPLPAPTQLVARPAAAPAPARAVPTVRRARQQNEALLMKAGRVLLGDGRHRPEPFPRIR